MFEYLMPLLVMRSYPETMLASTYQGAVARQIAYAQQHGIPWGIRLVLVHGARPQAEQRLREAGRELRYVNGLRLTDADDLRYVKQAVGRARIRIEALLSMGVANSPMHGARLRVVSGNLITARPLGVREGIDYGFTGEVRRIDDRAIRLWLDQNAIVLLSPLGYSPTGEIFNLSAEDVATATAMALRADKLLVLSESPAPVSYTHLDVYKRQILHMPGGQSGHPLSPFYRSGFDAWAKGEPAPLVPGQARHRLELRPDAR